MIGEMPLGCNWMVSDKFMRVQGREDPTADTGCPTSDSSLFALEPVLHIVDPGGQLLIAPPRGERRDLVGARKPPLLDHPVDHRLAETGAPAYLVKLHKALRPVGFGHHLLIDRDRANARSLSRNADSMAGTRSVTVVAP